MYLFTCKESVLRISKRIYLCMCLFTDEGSLAETCWYCYNKYLLITSSAGIFPHIPVFIYFTEVVFYSRRWPLFDTKTQ